MNDSELLKRYAENRCDDSFTKVVDHHIGLVFAAALRQVGGDRALAEEVTQSVFSDLARKAGAVAKHEVLAGWLYTSTRFSSAKAVRSEQRRRAREEQAFAMQKTSVEPNQDSEHLSQLHTVLDGAMHDLPEADRNALLLRFFEKRPLAEVGTALGVSADSARMRIERALDKLRKFLGKRGVASTSSALATLLAEPVLTAAPAGLAATVAGTTLAGAAGTVATIALIQFMGMTKIKSAAAAVLLASLSVPIVVQHRSNLELQRQNQKLAAETSALSGQIEPLKKENLRLTGLLAEQDQVAKRSNEVFKLRDEVTRLRADARPTIPAGPLDETLRTLSARAARLKDGLARMPERSIPELQLLTDQDWLNAVSHVEALETDEEQRQALSILRGSAKGKAGEKMRVALRKYGEANDGSLPSDLSQLHQYLDEPIDPTVLQRYKLTQTGKIADVPRDHNLIVETAPPVDDEYDTHYRFDLYGTTSSSFSRIGKVIEAAAVAYAEANQGRLPRDSALVVPFLQEPVEAARVQKTLDKIPPHVTTLAEMKEKR